MPTLTPLQRFGGDPAHPRLMMANLAPGSSPPEVDGHHQEARAKARPVTRLITKAKKAQDEGWLKFNSSARSRASQATL